MESIENIIGIAVSHRKEIGMTQSDVAEKMGISQPAVAKMENFQQQPRIDTLVRYLNAVGLSFLITEKLQDFKDNDNTKDSDDI